MTRGLPPQAAGRVPGAIVRISASASVRSRDGNHRVDALRAACEDGIECEGECADYLERELADLGITGGRIRLIFDIASNAFYIATEYQVPRDLKEAHLRRLLDETCGQWTDGIGENGFAALADLHGVSITFAAECPRSVAKVERIESDIWISKPLVASAARTGRLVDLQQLVEAGVDIEKRSQGYTPLHLAVLHGHGPCALELISHGADLRALDPLGQDSLLIAAVSRKIADQEATLIALALLNRGVPVEGYSSLAQLGRTPLVYARKRGKDRLAALLEAR